MRLDLLDDAALRACSPERLITLIAKVQRLIDTATAYQRRLIAMAEHRKAARAVGDISTADSLVRTTGMSRRRARRAQRQAKAIATQPEVADVLATGALNAEQAETIARAEVSGAARKRLLKAAAAGEAADTTRMRVAAAEANERSESPEEQFMRQRSKRFLRFYDNRDGMVCLHGAMDPDTGARVKARIASIAKHMWHQDKHQPHNQRRTPQQRDIDALHAATAPQPHTRNQPPAPQPPTRNQPHTPTTHQKPTTRTPTTRQKPTTRTPTTHPTYTRSGSLRRGDPASQNTTGLGERDVPSDRRNPAMKRRNPDHSYSRNVVTGDNRSGSGRSRSRRGRPGLDHSDGSIRSDGVSPSKAAPAGVTGTTNSADGAAAGAVLGGGFEGYRWRNRPLPVLRVSTSLQNLKNGLYRAGVTDTGDHLSAETLRRLACDAQIIPIVPQLQITGHRRRTTHPRDQRSATHRCHPPATNTAYGPAAPPRRTAATATTSNTGPMAAPPTSTTSPYYATATTSSYTKPTIVFTATTTPGQSSNKTTLLYTTTHPPPHHNIPTH